jgi:putative acetyltransferase
MLEGLSIDAETSADHSAVHDIVVAAFPTEAEARLVTALRAANLVEISLVARLREQPVGHVMFSPVTIEADGAVVAKGLGLAPVAVSPAHQRVGIGSALIRTGLEQAAQRATFCVVVGEPAYYARFGFRPASAAGITSEYDAGDAFMLRVFAAAPPAGLARYSEPFRSP